MAYSTSGFQTRLTTGKAFEDELEQILQAHPSIVSVAKNGTEHTHPVFVEQLRKNDTLGARRVRYAPDGVFLSKRGDVRHFEAKSGRALERAAYETYMAYRDMGCRVIVFMKRDQTIYYQDVERIQFIDSSDYVSKFPEAKRFPVTDDGWICPRKDGRALPPGMSGTEYRYVDFNSLKVWSSQN